MLVNAGYHQFHSECLINTIVQQPGYCCASRQRWFDKQNVSQVKRTLVTVCPSGRIANRKAESSFRPYLDLSSGQLALHRCPLEVGLWLP